MTIEIRTSPDGRAIHALLPDQPPVDVTESVLKSIVHFVGPGHTLGIRSAGRVVMQISVALPDESEGNRVNGS